ncbi:MAG: hypothetical protein K2F85_09055 [Helicobacter sp.]|nr:hypothetical protein [Helicobacter sp.]
MRIARLKFAIAARGLDGDKVCRAIVEYNRLFQRLGIAEVDFALEVEVVYRNLLCCRDNALVLVDEACKNVVALWLILRLLVFLDFFLVALVCLVFLVCFFGSRLLLFLSLIHMSEPTRGREVS